MSLLIIWGEKFNLIGVKHCGRPSTLYTLSTTICLSDPFLYVPVSPRCRCEKNLCSEGIENDTGMCLIWSSLRKRVVRLIHVRICGKRAPGKEKVSGWSDESFGIYGFGPRRRGKQGSNRCRGWCVSNVWNMNQKYFGDLVDPARMLQVGREVVLWNESWLLSVSHDQDVKWLINSSRCTSLIESLRMHRFKVRQGPHFNSSLKDQDYCWC